MIIGITGFAGSGKDTIAKIIKKRYRSYRKIAFADTLKDITAHLYDWDRGMLEGITEEDRKIREEVDIKISKIFNRKISPRNELKLIGVGLKKLLQEDIWSSIVKHKILTNKIKNVVITDVRFPDEIKMIRELGGIILEVQRGSQPEWYNYAASKNLGLKSIFTDIIYRKEKKQYNQVHPSEKDWIGINKPNYIIHNDGTIQDLENTIIRLMTELKGK